MMRIEIPRLSSLAAATLVWCASATTAAAQQIHPPGGGGATNPVVIAVLADGYTSTQSGQFDADAANFFLSGLLQDHYFKDKAGFMRITKVFDAVVPPVKSNYGFRMGVMDGACQVAFPTDTGPIWTAAASVGADYVVVIGNYPYTVGCSLGRVAYVSAGAWGVKVLEHEFAHMLASLWDEFGLPSSGSTSFPYPIPAGDKRNCARRPSHWGTPGIFGCGLYNAAIVRPTNMCRMGASHHPHFCKVCSDYFDDWFKDLQRLSGVGVPVGMLASQERTPQMGFVRAAFQPAPAPAKPPATQPILRLLLRFNHEKGTAELRRGFNSTGIYVPNHRRVGKYAYEILNDKGLVDFGVLSDQLFQARGYAGGVGPHGAAPTASTEVIVQIPGETIERLRQPTSNVSMMVWELLPDFPGGDINRGTFVKFRTDKFMRLTQVISAAEIRKVLTEPPPPPKQ